MACFYLTAQSVNVYKDYTIIKLFILFSFIPLAQYVYQQLQLNRF